MRKLLSLVLVVGFVLTACDSPDTYPHYGTYESPEWYTGEEPGWHTDGGDYIWSQAKVFSFASMQGTFPGLSTSTAQMIFLDTMGYPVAEIISPLGNMEARRCNGRAQVLLNGNDPRLTDLDTDRIVWVAFELHEFSKDYEFREFRNCKVHKIKFSHGGEQAVMDALEIEESAP